MENNQTDNYPLDEATINLLAEFQRAAADINARLQGALTLFLRQHKLEGNWSVAQNGRELVKQQAPVAAVQPQ
jgi:hypothetical protein